MTVASESHFCLDRPLAFHIEGSAFKRDPFPTLAAMRKAGPVIPLKLSFVGRAWMTTSYEATSAMLKDQSLFVQESRHAGKTGIAGLQWWMPRSLKLLANNMLLKDEPDHRRLRKLVDQAFQRRGVLDMRDNIEAIADRLLDDISTSPSLTDVDLVSSYARRLPLEVISDLLGLPHKDREAFASWAHRSLAADSPVGAIAAIHPLMKMIRYVHKQIDDCRRHPRDGLIGELVRAEKDGDKLDGDELASMILLLLVAGFETTTHLIATSILALEIHPKQKAWLFSDPAKRMEIAVEELTRFNSPVQTTKPRYVSRDCTFFGQRLKRGQIIMAMLASANSDPANVPNPETLDLSRAPAPHLAYGSGIHFCLGMQLARLEAQTALSRLYVRFPNLELIDSGQLDWIKRLGLRGLKHLPARLNDY